MEDPRSIDMDIELQKVGAFGRFHWIIFFVLAIPSVLVGSANFSYVFIAAAPNSRCFVPQCEINPNNGYEQSFLNFTTPLLPDGSYDGCRMYAYLNTTEYDDDNFTTPLPDTCTADHFSENVTVPCPDGIIFDQSTYISTIVTEFNLTCENAHYAPMSMSVFFFGILTGSFISGFVADKFGRKTTILVNMLFMALFGILTAFARSYLAFNLMRFFSAAAASGVFQTAFVLVLEFVTPNYRVMVSMVGQVLFTVGELVVDGVAYSKSVWQDIQMIISAPLAVGLLLCILLPESPRWLLSEGRIAELKKLLLKVQHTNDGRSCYCDFPCESCFPSTDQDEDYEFTEGAASQSDSPPVPAVSLMQVFRTPRLLVRLLAMIFIWIIVTMVYYGISFNSTALGNASAASPSKPYIDFALVSLVEVPGYFMAYILLHWLGRRSTLIISMCIAAVSVAVSAIIYDQQPKVMLAFFVLGKFGITSAFGTIYLYTAEIFPTNVRNSVIGICSTGARLGGICAPFTIELKDVWPRLPHVVFASLSAIPILLTLLMPETKNKALPNTIEEALMLEYQSTTLPVLADEEGRRLLSSDEEPLESNDDQMVDEIDAQNDNENLGNYNHINDDEALINP